VRARLDGQHDVFAAQDAGHRVHSARDSLSQKHQIRLYSAPFVAQEFACSGDSGLDLVADQEYVVFVAQGAGFAKVVIVGNDDAGFSLDGFNQEGCEGGTGFLECLTQGGLVVVRDRLISSGNGTADVGEIWAIVLAGFGV